MVLLICSCPSFANKTQSSVHLIDQGLNFRVLNKSILLRHRLPPSIVSWNSSWTGSNQNSLSNPSTNTTLSLLKLVGQKLLLANTLCTVWLLSGLFWVVPGDASESFKITFVSTCVSPDFPNVKVTLAGIDWTSLSVCGLFMDYTIYVHTAYCIPAISRQMLQTRTNSFWKVLKTRLTSCLPRSSLHPIEMVAEGALRSDFVEWITFTASSKVVSLLIDVILMHILIMEFNMFICRRINVRQISK